MDTACDILALPENIKTLIKLGKWIVDTIQLYRNASPLLQDWRTYGYELHTGTLCLQLQLAEQFVDTTVDANKQLAVKVHIAGLANVVSKAKVELRRCGDEKSNRLDRWYFALKGSKRLKNILKEFREKVYDFTVYIVMLDMVKRTFPRDLLITGPSFKTTSRYGDDCSIPLQLGTERIRFGAAEYKKDGQLEETDILFERHKIGTRSAEDVEETVKELTKHLTIEPQSLNGILRCLGYRKEPNLELIFQIPKNLESPRTLHKMITDEKATPSVAIRIGLARDIAEAVALVHAAKLVHKSLRPETIVVFTDSSKENTETNLRPFLTDWSIMRSMGDPSGRIGSDAWVENIYRHPQRQGLQLEKRYHMGHDTYSLGVTMLELGLYESFIVDDDGTPEPSQLYRHAAITASVITADMKDAESRKAMLKPAAVKEVMLHLAKEELRFRMGSEYSDIVRLCLCAVEKGIAGVSAKEFKDDPVLVSKRFRQAVIEPLVDICEFRKEGEKCEGGT